MGELSFLKINESQISMDAYKSIMDNYVAFLKYFYGKDIDLTVREGSQVMQAIKADNQDIDDSTVKDFDEVLALENIDRKTYIANRKPLEHLFEISNVKRRFQLQDFTLSFNNKKISVGDEIYKKLSLFCSKDKIKELTSIAGSIHLVSDKNSKLMIKITDKEDKRDIHGIIKTNNKDDDDELFNKIRKEYFGEDVLVSAPSANIEVTFS